MGAIGDWFARAFTPSDSDQHGMNDSSAIGQAFHAGQGAAGAAGAAGGTGNLTDDEAKGASASRAFRIGTFFTSPTGVLNTAKRRGTKLLGG